MSDRLEALEDSGSRSCSGGDDLPADIVQDIKNVAAAAAVAGAAAAAAAAAAAGRAVTNSTLHPHASNAPTGTLVEVKRGGGRPPAASDDYQSPATLAVIKQYLLTALAFSSAR